MPNQSNNININKQPQQCNKKSIQQQKQQSSNNSQPYNSQISYILCEQLSNCGQNNSINYIRKSKHDLKISKILKSKDIKISYHKLPINGNINSNNSVMPMSILNKSISKTNGNRQNQYDQQDKQYEYEQIYNNNNNNNNNNNMNMNNNMNINMNNSRLSKQQKQQSNNNKKSISISNNHRNYHYQNNDNKQMNHLQKNQKQPSIFATPVSTPFTKKIQKKQSGKSIYRNIKQTQNIYLFIIQQIHSHSQQKPYKNQHQQLQLHKQNSYHFLDKNNFGLLDKNGITYMPIQQISSKLDERICLPVLVNNNMNSMMKNNNNNKATNRLQQNTSINNNNITNNPNLEPYPNSYSPQPIHLPNQSSPLTPIPTPYTQKIVKIPIQRLKPLKPQQIKLKYQKKIKQQQRNRAKDIAIQIFNKQQQNNNDIDDLLKQQQSERENIIEKNGIYSVDSRIKKNINVNINNNNNNNNNNLNNITRNSNNIFAKLNNNNPEKVDHQYIDLQREYINKKANYNSNTKTNNNNNKDKDIAYNFTNGKSQNIFKKQPLVYNS